MAIQVAICPTPVQAIRKAAGFMLRRLKTRPNITIGLAAGAGVAAMIERLCHQARRDMHLRQLLLSRTVVFLSEQFGKLYHYHWASRNLLQPRYGEVFFSAKNIFLPRSIFYETRRGIPCLVTGNQLRAILRETEGEWERREVACQSSATSPEIRILDTASHPVLLELKRSMEAYHHFVCAECPRRLQILELSADCTFGYLKPGAVERTTPVVLVELCASPAEAQAKNDYSPDDFAITQGVASVMSTEELLILAWGADKQKAVRAMLQQEPTPHFPASWLREHQQVQVCLDRSAAKLLSEAALRSCGVQVVRH